MVRSDSHEKENKENHAILSAFTSSRPGYSEDYLYTIAIPSGHTKTGLPDKLKYEGYVSNLTDRIMEGFAVNIEEEVGDDDDGSTFDPTIDEPDSVGSNPEFDSINGKICGTCKGHCCLTAGNHAYIDRATIVRFRRQNPQVTAEELLNEYLSYLGAESVEGGCINQMEKGCVLPRERRRGRTGCPCCV